MVEHPQGDVLEGPVPALRARWIVSLFGASLLLGASFVAPAERQSAEKLESIEIQVGDFVFDALAAGPEEGELVLLLHGFPQTGYSYRHQLRALGAAGYRAVAPDQRGYSPGARPSEVAAYGMTHLVGDVVGMATSLGRQRFHLLGHDWGGAVAWATATFQPQRVVTLTVLSTPHYLALAQSYADPESEQAQRSAYFDDFAAEGAEARFLAEDMALLRGILAGTGVPDVDLEVYLQRLGTPEAMRATLNWYSALVAAQAGSTPSVASVPAAGLLVPTLYLWGTQDPAFASAAAQNSASFVAAPLEFHSLTGRGHWLPEEVPDTVTRLLLEHLGRSFPDLRSTPPARHFDTVSRRFTSTASPRLALAVPERYVYLGRLGFPLKEVAWVDRHLFAELEGRSVRSLLVLQFEGFLEGAESRYRFGIPSGADVAGGDFRFSPERVDLGGHHFVHNTWAFDWRASAASRPGFESDRTLRFLEGRGLEMEDGWMMSRFVREVGPEQRQELILFYLVPLATRGQALAAFPDGGPVSAVYDELSSEITAESLHIFDKLEEQ